MDHNEGKPVKLFPQTMSIVKIVAPLKYKRNIIRELEQLGKIEPIQVDPRTGTDHIAIEERRNQIESLRSKFSQLVASLDKKHIKKGTPQMIGKSEEQVLEAINEIYKTHGSSIEEILKRKSDISERKEELDGLKTILYQMSTLGSGKKLKQSHLADTIHTKTFVGTIFNTQTNRLYWYVSEVSNNKYFIIDQVLNDKETIALVTVLQNDAEATHAKLKSMNFQEITLPNDVDLDGLSISDCDQELVALESEEVEIENKIQAFTKENGFYLLAALEACEIELQRISVEFKMRRTKTTCVLWAWLPEDMKETFRTAMHQATEGSSIIDFRKGDLDPEIAPSYSDNSKFMEPMRGLVNSFGTPSSHEVDPYPFVKWMFPILFAIMFADVGHGFLLLLFGLYAKRKKDQMDEIPNGISGYFYGGAELLIIMGITSFFFGFAFNSFFGDETILWKFTPAKLLFEHTTWAFLFKFEEVDGHQVIERNYVNLLILSFVVGAFVILLGLVLNIYQLSHYRHSDAEYKAAISLCLIYVFAILGAIFAVLGIPILMWLCLLSSLACVVITLTIEYKAHKIDGVMLGIDHIISLLSNTFSFGRLLAMNTIHFVLAFLPYLFLDKVWPGVLNHSVEHISWLESTQLTVVWIVAAFLGACIVLPVETVFSTLQSLRLNWVEFFGKFYKGEGVAFHPVKVIRTYTVETAGE